jgi:hypothetical protein
VAKFTKFFGGLFSNAGGYALGSATADALRPALQEVVNTANATHPAIPLSAQQAAQAEIVGAYDAADVRRDASWQGLNATRANALRALAGQAPGFSQLAQLRNRGRITDAEFERGLAQLGIRDEWRDDVRALRFALPSGPELAEMAVQGVLDVDDARAVAATVGTDAANFDRYFKLAGDPPGGAQLLDLWNRREITEADVDRGLRQSRLKPEWIDRVKALRRYLIPPSDTIRLAVREVYDAEKRAALDLDAEFPPAFAAKAALLGISESDARDLWAGHWDLPSYTQGANMMFRGEISPAEFDTLLAALDYAPTWRKGLANIARAIPTLSDMVRFAVRDVYVPARRRALDLDAEYPEPFTAQAAKHGLAQSDAEDYWAAHWKLPSATQGFRMLWRGEIDDDGLGSLLKALDYAPTWRDKLANIARPTLGRIDIRRAFAAGIIPRARALELYGKLGYTSADAEIMVALAKPAAATTTKDLTLAQLTSEYERGMLDAGAYAAEVKALGYDTDEVKALQALADRKRIDRAREQKISTIRTAYVGHRLREPEARAALTASAIPSAAVDAVFAEWSDARAANVRILTPTNLKALYKAAKITRDEALDQLAFRGYDAENAARLIETWT